MFDAGSTGSRVHVYSFRPNGELADEVFRQIQPGLSAYADPAEVSAAPGGRGSPTSCLRVIFALYFASC